MDAVLNFLTGLFGHYKTSVAGFILAGANYEAGLHGPHASQWATVASVATLLLGAFAADASSKSNGASKNSAGVVAKFVPLLILVFVLLTITAHAQTPTPTPPATPSCADSPLNCPAFKSNSMQIGLTPITLPNFGTTLSGVETNTMFNFTENNQLGMTALISDAAYTGPRYNRIFPSVSSWLQNHTALQGNSFQAGISFSGGVVAAKKKQWGADIDAFLNFKPSGSDKWAVAFKFGAAYLPGIVNANGGHAKFIPKVSIGPTVSF